MVLDNEVYGGCPPTLDDITEHREMLESFKVALFGKQVHLKEGVPELLLASVIRFYDDFWTFVFNEPRNNFKCVTNHIFIQMVSFF